MRIAILLFVLQVIGAIVPAAVEAQANMFDHEFWHAYGTRDGAQWGGAGLDTIGFVNDTIRHAISIAESRGNAGYVSSYVYNRTRLDTVRHVEFPGRDVLRGEINGDQYLDVVTVDPTRRVTTVLFGTAKPDSFVTALVLDANDYPGSKVTNTILLEDCDGDGMADLVISDGNFQNSTGARVGRLSYFKGGPLMKSTPTESVSGHVPLVDVMKGALMVGRFRDTTRRFLALARPFGPGANAETYDTLRILLYPLGDGFHLVPTDSIVCAVDTTRFVSIDTWWAVYAMDVTGDGVGDVMFSGTDKDYGSQHLPDPTIFVYPGGLSGRTLPTNYFHGPDPHGTSSKFGTKILDIGDVVGRHYHSILVTDPGALVNSTGAVFMYNVGAALKDSCVAYALGPRGSRDEFGIQAISPGDLTSDGRSEIMIGSPINADGYYFGTLWAFNGDSSYGPAISGVRDGRTSVSGLDLSPCYPNPANSTTDISFAVTAAHMHGAEVTIKLYDMLGREVGTVYRGGADAYRTDVRLDVSRLTPGAYTYRLVCGTQQRSGTLTVVR